MKQLFSLFLVLAVSLTVTAQYNYNDVGDKLANTFKVKGGAGIVQFAKAVSSVLPYDQATAVVDKRNGFISDYSEGDGHYEMNMCYWRCDDGTKLFVVSYSIATSTNKKKAPIGRNTLCHYSAVHPVEGAHGQYEIHNIGYACFSYDESSSTLFPVDLPFDFMPEAMGIENAYYLELPQNGKDIVVRMGVGHDIDHTLYKWNGQGWENHVPFAVGVIVNDTDQTSTNVRNAPFGDIVCTLENGDMIKIDECENGWMHIADLGYQNAESYISSYTYHGDKWIHGSVINAGWVGSFDGKLHAAADSDSRVVYRCKNPGANVNEQIECILDLDELWVKVRLANGKEGWVHGFSLCGNSLTDCP